MRMILILAAAALAACSAKETKTKAEAAADAAPKASQPAASGPADDKAESSADTAWIELLGRWAPKGACADETQAWKISAAEFDIYETHCAVTSIELIEGGVKAISDCSVEGDNDGAPDLFEFKRQPDATLTIVNGANGARTEGLVPCSEDVYAR